MKISHKDLENCRVSPRLWVANQQSGGGWPKFGYNRALNLAIGEFLTTGSLHAANDKVDGYVAKNLKDAKRIAKLYESLDEYVRWFNASGIISADANIRLGFPYLEDWQLGGIISRVDVLTSGYRAVLFESIAPGWKDQLRMPLIQMAVAEQYGRPASEIKVGFQDLDGNALVDTLYNKTIRDTSLEEFKTIGAKVLKLWPKSKP